MQLQRTARMNTLQLHAPSQHDLQPQESVSSGSLLQRTAVGNAKAIDTRSNAAGQRLKADPNVKGEASQFLKLDKVSEQSAGPLPSQSHFALFSHAFNACSLCQVQDPWLTHSIFHEASVKNARKPPFSFSEAKPALYSPSKQAHRSPRATLHGDEGVQQDSQRSDISGLFVADRFRSFLKRENARKPVWL
jgi:hypothetical protein